MNRTEAKNLLRVADILADRYPQLKNTEEDIRWIVDNFETEKKVKKLKEEHKV